MVIFGGKTQASGVFFNEATVQAQEKDMVDLSQGSPLNVIMFMVPRSVQHDLLIENS